MRDSGRIALLALLLGGALSACSDSTDTPPEPPPPPPPPPISLDATGIYTGVMEGDGGEVALLQIVVARSGETAVVLQEDDTEQATRLALGSSEQNGSELDFSGEERLEGGELTLDWMVTGNASGSGNLQASGLQGAFTVTRAAAADASVTLEQLVGSFLSANGLQLTITEDGGVTASGSCEGQGSAVQPDASVNVFTLELSGGCGEITGVAFLDQLVATGDVLVVQAAAEGRTLSGDWFRL